MPKPEPLLTICIEEPIDALADGFLKIQPFLRIDEDDIVWSPNNNKLPLPNFEQYLRAYYEPRATVSIFNILNNFRDTEIWTKEMR